MVPVYWVWVQSRDGRPRLASSVEVEPQYRRHRVGVVAPTAKERGGSGEIARVGWNRSKPFDHHRVCPAPAPGRVARRAPRPTSRDRPAVAAGRARRGGGRDRDPGCAPPRWRPGPDRRPNPARRRRSTVSCAPSCRDRASAGVSSSSACDRARRAISRSIRCSAASTWACRPSRVRVSFPILVPTVSPSSSTRRSCTRQRSPSEVQTSTIAGCDRARRSAVTSMGNASSEF